MIKRYFLFVAVLTILSADSCKKKDDDGFFNGGNELNFTPEYIAPSQSGIIQVSANTIILKVGESASISAKLYEANGTEVSVQPTFNYTSEVPQIATVANGNINAIAEGETNIEVTDGLHGSSYVSVIVIGTSQTPPSDVYNIAFFPPILSLKQGESASFSYKIFDRKGNEIFPGTPTFVLSGAFGDATVSGTSVTAGSQSGVFSLLASIGGTNLLGSLQMVFGIPNGSNSSTSYVIDQVYYPCGFSSLGIKAKPVKVSIIETQSDGNGNVVISKYETSPDQITIKHPSVITNNGGRLQSVYPGYCKLAVMYKGVTVEGWSVVRPQLQGCWRDPSGQISLEFFTPLANIITYFVKYKYDFSLALPVFSYTLACLPGTTYDGELGQGGIDGLKGNEEPMYSGISSPNPSQWNSTLGILTDGYYLGQSATMKACSTYSLGSSFFEWNDTNRITLSSNSNSNNYTLSRGCESSPYFGDTVHIFGTAVSNNAACELTYGSGGIILFISDDNIKNDTLRITVVAGIDDMPGKNCASSGTHMPIPVDVKIPIQKNSSNIWEGDATFVYYDTFLFKLKNGTLTNNNNTFTGEVEVTSSQWQTMTKQITMMK
ncbi:MAG: Ig-like domain-containing protein [Chitinophagales bacterium]|nr:Ig-like domain-containing protein [Chitinophagales bacterium]